MQTFDEAQQPALAVGPNGLIALTMIQRGNIVVVLSQDGGGSFSAPIVAIECRGQARGGRQRGPRIAIDRQGGITITAPATFDPEEQKKRYPAPELQLVQSQDGGRSFSAPVRVNPVSKKAPEGLHALRISAEGIGHIAWLDISERLGPGQDLFYARIEKGKLIVAPPLARTICECCAPGLALDEKGNPTVVWREGGLKESREVFLRRSFDGGRHFGPAERINTDPTKESTCPMSAPAVVISADGKRIWTAWKHINRRESHISWREATGQAPDRDLQPQAGGTQDHPVLSVAADGSWTAVWEEKRGGQQSIWYRTSKPGDTGRSLSPPEAGQAAFPVLVESNHNTVVAYEVRQGERLQVITHLVTPSGNPTKRGG